MCNTDTCDCELSLDFEILAFPCNQFRGQEPGSSEEIQNVVCTRFKAEFPVFDKVITVIYCKFFVTYLTFDTLCMEMVLFGLDVLGNFPSQILYAFFFLQWILQGYNTILIYMPVYMEIILIYQIIIGWSQWEECRTTLQVFEGSERRNIWRWYQVELHKVLSKQRREGCG